MIAFLARRGLRLGTRLLGVAVLTFLLMRAIPGNPWSNYAQMQRALLGVSLDPAARRRLEHRFGLDLPLWRQFTRYLIGDFDATGAFDCGALCGDLGPSTQQSGRTVQAILFEGAEGRGFWESRFGYSVRLVALATALVVGLGLPLGMLGARAPRSRAGRALSLTLTALVSIPSFVLGLLAVLVLASWLKLIQVLPDWNDPGNWLVPAAVLAALPLASLARVTRAAVLNIQHEPYILAARARGVPAGRLRRNHVFRNALAPILTFLGPAVIEMFTGLLIVENQFAFPGFGQVFWRAVLALDYPLILGVTLVYAAGMLGINALMEALAGLADPRLRLK